MKIFVVGKAFEYATWITGYELTEQIEDADIVLFTGGEDVCPKYYGAKKHQYTYCSERRDQKEKEIWDKVQTLEHKPLCLGICRGSQFLTVMNGGKLIQHVNNHGIFNTHSITFTDTNEKYEITSTHHQMMFPFNLLKSDYQILAKSTDRRSTIYEGDGIQIPPVEPEVIYYPKTNSLCIQGHPEFMNSKQYPIVDKLINLINKYLNDEKIK